jgi:prepilin signal peptidase PulO-like enzyme (type II secretory pathway)
LQFSVVPWRGLCRYAVAVWEVLVDVVAIRFGILAALVKALPAAAAAAIAVMAVILYVYHKSLDVCDITKRSKCSECCGAPISLLEGTCIHKEAAGGR